MPGRPTTFSMTIRTKIFSIWMHECQAAFFKCRHAQMGENPELRTLFYRLANLLKLCLIPVFVFDGVGRPKSKRGQKVSGEAHWITERFIAFIDAFGFHSHYVRYTFVGTSVGTHFNRLQVKLRLSLHTSISLALSMPSLPRIVTSSFLEPRRY